MTNQNFNEFAIENLENVVGGRKGRGKRRRRRKNFLLTNFPGMSGMNCSGIGNPVEIAPELTEEEIQMQIAEAEAAVLENVNVEDDLAVAAVLILQP